MDDAIINGRGRAALFACGSVVEFAAVIDDSHTVEKIVWRSDGCPAMNAAAAKAVEIVGGRDLRSLHGSSDLELQTDDEDRRECVAAVASAIRNCFADHRSRVVSEYHGDDPLICTCFGVGENAIASAIEKGAANDVDAVGEVLNAGTGCGSCRALIQELLDEHHRY